MTEARRRTFRVPAAAAGERLDRVVALETGESRREVAELVSGGAVLVDGVAVTTRSHRVHEGAEVVVDLPVVDDDPCPPDPTVEVSLVHVDEHLLVVDKPAGLVVHPGAGHPTGTLVQGLLARFPELAQVGDPSRPGIVHRLDRDTTGLLVVARSPEAHERLVAALAARTVGRRYRTVVDGRPVAPSGRVDAPIGRSGRDPTRMVVRPDGREARTDYEVLGVNEAESVALLECRLHTGRTHQIRVHLAAIDLRVLGDSRYGVMSHGARRPMLHAWRLELEHPVTGEELVFTSPDPADLAELITRLDLEPRTTG